MWNEPLAMKCLVPIPFLAIAVAVCATVCFLILLEPTSIGAFVFLAVWLISPYAAISAGLIALHRTGTALIHWHVVALIVSSGGLLFLTYVIFLSPPDAQGAMGVFITPMLQGGALVLLLPLVWLLAPNARPAQGHQHGS